MLITGVWQRKSSSDLGEITPTISRTYALNTDSKREAPEWAEPSEPYVFGELTIDYAERRVTLAGRPVQLTVIEYGLLFELSANAGRVMTYDRLLQRVWGLRGSGDSRRVRTAAKQLRRKLGDDANNPTYILNEPRVGYRMPKGEGQELEDGFRQMR